MMGKGIAIVAAALILLVAAAHPLSAGEREIHKEFDGVKAVKLNTVSGDCIIKSHRSNTVIVDLVYEVDPEDAIDFKFEERRSKLVIKERWHGSSSSSHVIWTLTVPEEAEIDFSTASGDIEVTGPVGEIEASTASGDIELDGVSGDVEVSTASGDVTIIECDGEMNISTASGDVEGTDVAGEMDISTASGEIEIDDSRGSFELSCASGEISADNITVEGSSSFSTASGSVEVVLAETSKYDLSLSAASGDVTLDYNGNPVVGYFEFEARKRRASIKCPFEFDDEEEFEKWDNIYVRKSFSRKGDDPAVYLSTASGKIVLKK
jgi:DUF4097 and DUF4098 domain-containing protein YvlB